MTKSQTLPPDITVTRADVLALPLTWANLMPDEGYVWVLRHNSEGRLRWVEVWGPESHMWRSLKDSEIAAAERVFLWQTALASDAALADIGNDPAPSAPPTLPLPALAYLRREARMVEPGDESWRNRYTSIKT